MKLMIASDIHGSYLYCNELMKRYEAEKPDRLVLLGDILYHGPRNNLPGEYNPKNVIELLNPLKKKYPLRARKLRHRGRSNGA